MSHDNRQQYSMNQMGRDQNNPNQYQGNNQQYPYNQYDQQNMGMNYNQQVPGHMSMGGNPNNLSGGMYPHGGQFQQDRNQPSQMHGMQHNQGYHEYSHPGQSQHQPPMQNYQNVQGYRQDGGNYGYSSQMNTGMGQQQDRNQHYNSHHEASAPLSGGLVNQGSFMNKQHEFSSQPERNFNNNTPLYRNESSMPQNYNPPAMSDIQRNAHMGSGPSLPQNNEPNLIGGFLSQTSNQPPSQMPGQQYNQGSGIGMPRGQNDADPSSMDIGALNRMAEYYATNSDYPKVHILQFNLYRQLSTSKRWSISAERTDMHGLHW